MTSPVQAASLFAKIGADSGSFKREMDMVDSRIDTTDSKMGRLHKAMGGALKVAAGVGAAGVGALGAGLAVATKQAAGMEQGVADISAVMTLTGEETKRVKGLVKDLGLDPNLKVSATEAAGAIEMLGKNGVAVNDIMNGMARSTVLLANSTGGDFALSADLATDAMSLFNLQAKDMDMVVNQITGTTQSSKFSIDDYKLALAQGAKGAVGAGMSFEQFNQMIAATAFNFDKGSSAGVGLTAMLLGMSPRTDKAAELMQELGIVTSDGTNRFFDQAGQLKSNIELSKVMQETLGSLSPELRSNAVNVLFGRDAMAAVNGMIGVTTESWQQYQDQILATDAEAAAAKRMDTLSGDFEIFQGVIETITIGVGEGLIPAFRSMVKWITAIADEHGKKVVRWAEDFGRGLLSVTNWVKGLARGEGPILNDWFEGLPGPMEEVITKAVALWKEFGFIITAVKDTITEFFSWKDVMIAAAAIVGSMVLPALAGIIAGAAPVIAIVGGLVTAVAVMRNAWEKDWGGVQVKIKHILWVLGQNFGGLIDTIKQFGGDAIKEIANWVMGNETEFSGLKKIWESVRQTAAQVWPKIKDAAVKAMDRAKKAVTDFGDSVWKWFFRRFPQAAARLTTITKDIQEKWSTAWSKIQDALKKAKDFVDSRFGELAGVIKAFGVDSLKEIWGWVTGTGDGFEATRKILDAASAAFQTVFDDIKGLFLTLKDRTVERLREWGGEIWKWFSREFPDAARILKDAFDKLKENWERLTDSLSATMKAFKDRFGGNEGMEGLQKAVEIGKVVISTAVTIIANTIGGAMNMAVEALTLVSDLLRGDWKAAWETTKRMIKTVVETWKTNIVTILDAILSAFGTNTASMISMAKEKYGQIRTNIVDVWTRISDNVRGIWSSIRKIYDKWIVGSVNAIKERYVTIKDDIIHMWSTTRENVERKVDNLRVRVNMIKTQMKNKVIIAYNDMKEKVEEVWKAISGFVDKYINPKKWMQNAKDWVQGIWDGVSDRWTRFTGWLDKQWEKLPDGFTKFFKMRSPSILMKNLAKNIPAGIEAGFDAGFPAVLTAAKGHVEDVGAALTDESNWAGIKGEMTSIAQDVSGAFIDGMKFEIPEGFAMDALGNLVVKTPDAILPDINTVTDFAGGLSDAGKNIIAAAIGGTDVTRLISSRPEFEQELIKNSLKAAGVPITGAVSAPVVDTRKVARGDETVVPIDEMTVSEKAGQALRDALKLANKSMDAVDFGKAIQGFNQAFTLGRFDINRNELTNMIFATDSIKNAVARQAEAVAAGNVLDAETMARLMGASIAQVSKPTGGGTTLSSALSKVLNTTDQAAIGDMASKIAGFGDMVQQTFVRAGERIDTTMQGALNTLDSAVGGTLISFVNNRPVETNLASESPAALFVNAINKLIEKIDEAGLTPNINLEVAPTSTGDFIADIENLLDFILAEA